ncbi:cation diffusion facilitator family transporter [Candidatus Latescibacterota bacterium]
MNPNNHNHPETDTHSHDHHGNGHSHDVSGLSTKKLWIALAVNALFLIVEFVGGLLTNSLALLADAGHMLTDVAALALALFVAWLAEQPPTGKRTYGFLRAEVLGAFVNASALVVITVMIFWEAFRRLQVSPEIDGPVMIVIAALGLIANAVSAWVLFGSRNDTVNLKGAFLHMTSDALGSVGAITAGIVILFTGWTPVDAIASFVIGVLILWSTWGLLSQTVNILLESTPDHIDYDEVKDAILNIDHVIEVHDLHIWTIASGIPSLSAHVRLRPECSDTDHWQECLLEAQTMIRERFGIIHSTLQFEPQNYQRDERSI